MLWVNSSKCKAQSRPNRDHVPSFGTKTTEQEMHGKSENVAGIHIYRTQCVFPSKQSWTVKCTSGIRLDKPFDQISLSAFSCEGVCN